MRDKGRAGIYLIAALYMLYSAYQVFGFRNDNNGEQFMLMVIFSAVFVVAGIALGGASFYIMKKVKAAEQEAVAKQEEQEAIAKQEESDNRTADN